VFEPNEEITALKTADVQYQPLRVRENSKRRRLGRGSEYYLSGT